jgi:hypothetical protein
MLTSVTVPKKVPKKAAAQGGRSWLNRRWARRAALKAAKSIHICGYHPRHSFAPMTK